MNALEPGRPETSAGLPIFNREAKIAEAPRGALTKITRLTFEVVVAGKDSTDQTASIVEGTAKTDRRVQRVTRFQLEAP